MKAQFQSTEALIIRLSPFVSKVSGDYIVSGADVCTLSIEKPDGTLHTGATVTATWDAVSKTWKYIIATEFYAQGEWVVYAVSDDINCLPKWQAIYWGDYVDDITAAKTSAQAVNTKLGSPVGASVSVDIASLLTTLGTPEGASVSADIAPILAAAVAAQAAAEEASATASGLEANLAETKADAAAAKSAAQAAQASALSAAVDVAIIKKVQIGRWKIIGSQLVLYEIDDSTEYKRFDLKDDLGNPSGTRIFERVPQ